MTPVAIKICGITNEPDLQKCLDLQVGWIGFNCYPKSARYVTPEQLQKLTMTAGDKVQKVGVFVNADTATIRALYHDCGLNWVQLHGDETPEFADQLGVPYFKAFRVKEHFDFNQIKAFRAPYFLLDAYHPDHYGGSGDTFNWAKARATIEMASCFLAGGLNPENIQDAIRQTRPFGIDVCSGVEATPGKKNHQNLIRLIQNIHQLENT